MTSFSYNLRKLREFRNLSPQQMAENIGQSVRTYLKNESGEREMTRTELKTVAQLLEIPEQTMLSLGELSLSDILFCIQERLVEKHQPELTKKLELRISNLERKLESIELLLFKTS